VASSVITIRTSGSQGTIIRLHIGDMIAYYHPSLCTFENIGVIKMVSASSTIIIPTSWIQGTIIRLVRIGDMIGYYHHPSFCTFDNICVI
jgi:hypothetical protein